MKNLRERTFDERTQKYDEIPMAVTGEYGDEKKRPHWHLLLFNWRPDDLVYKYTNQNGDKLYSSVTLDGLWGKGITEVGQITFQSAGYVMRYAAKKLVHGWDQDHDYHPISKKSQKYAIGKKFLEKYWKDIFHSGACIMEGGQTCAIPRYYEKWLEKNHWEEWLAYVTGRKADNIRRAVAKNMAYEKCLIDSANKTGHYRVHPSVTKSITRETILKQKFQQLQKYLKGDI